jgi:hypothetical protein
MGLNANMFTFDWSEVRALKDRLRGISMFYMVDACSLIP